MTLRTPVRNSNVLWAREGKMQLFLSLDAWKFRYFHVDISVRLANFALLNGFTVDNKLEIQSSLGFSLLKWNFDTKTLHTCMWLPFVATLTWWAVQCFVWLLGHALCRIWYHSSNNMRLSSKRETDNKDTFLCSYSQVWRWLTCLHMCACLCAWVHIQLWCGFYILVAAA